MASRWGGFCWGRWTALGHSAALDVLSALPCAVSHPPLAAGELWNRLRAAIGQPHFD